MWYLLLLILIPLISISEIIYFGILLDILTNNTIYILMFITILFSTISLYSLLFIIKKTLPELTFILNNQTRYWLISIYILYLKIFLLGLCLFINTIIYKFSFIRIIYFIVILLIFIIINIGIVKNKEHKKFKLISIIKENNLFKLQLFNNNYGIAYFYLAKNKYKVNSLYDCIVDKKQNKIISIKKEVLDE